MAAFRTSKSGKVSRFGHTAATTISPAEGLICATLDSQACQVAPVQSTPKGMTQQCWAGQSAEGDMAHNSRGKRTLSATTLNMIRENMRNRK